MKKNKKIKKLQFTKETIARLEEKYLASFKGGDGVKTTEVATDPGHSCGCFTNASIDGHCE